MMTRTAFLPSPPGRGAGGEGRIALTLLEVIVSMAIFLLSVIAIFQLVFMGSERAMEVRLQARTSLRCQSKLAEVMIGAEPLNSTGNYAAFADSDKDLQWKIEVESKDEKGLLYLVKVWVKAELPGSKLVESYLCQMILNPAMRGTTFDEPK